MSRELLGDSFNIKHYRKYNLWKREVVSFTANLWLVNLLGIIFISKCFERNLVHWGKVSSKSHKALCWNYRKNSPVFPLRYAKIISFKNSDAQMNLTKPTCQKMYFASTTWRYPWSSKDCNLILETKKAWYEALAYATR